MKDIELLSEKRFDEVKELFIKYDIGLSEKCILLYANAFEILSRIVNHKLSTKEIFEVYIFLSEWLEKEQYHNWYLEKHYPEEYIISVIGWMEIKFSWIDKLTEEEKKLFVIILNRGHRVVADYESETINDRRVHMGFEKEFSVKAKLNFIRNRESDDETYGYSIENPVRLWSYSAIYTYLKNLRYKGEEIEAVSCGVWHNSNNYRVGKFDIYLLKGKLKSKSEKIATIYIDGNSNAVEAFAPKGFALAEDMINIGSILGLTRDNLYGRRK